MRAKTARNESSRAKSTDSKVEERSSSAAPKAPATDDELQTGQALPLQKTASGQNPRKNHQYAHAWIEEEKRQLDLPQTNPRKNDSASPDDVKSVQKKETSFWIASWHACRSYHQTNDCDARQSGSQPAAAVHQTRQEPQRKQQAKRHPQQASQP